MRWCHLVRVQLTMLLAAVCSMAVCDSAIAQEAPRIAPPNVARLFPEEMIRRQRPPEGALLFERVRAKRVAIQPLQQPGQPGGGILVLADRRMIQRLNKAGEFIEQQKYGDAVTLLQIILDHAEDSFFHPDPEKKLLYRSLKAEAQRQVGGMPAEGLRVYELQHGETARAMLDEALQSDNLEGAAEVSRRFFFTKAGREAMYHVGSAHFDRGRALAAALCFKQLLDAPPGAAELEPGLSLKAALALKRAGMEENARTILADLRKSLNTDSVNLGAGEQKLFDEGGDAIAWLERRFGTVQTVRPSGVADWAMVRGNAARNGLISAEDDRHLPAWQSPVATVFDVTRFPTDPGENKNDEDLQKAVKEAEAALAQRQQIALPHSQPLFVDGTMYVRTIGNILALDPANGSRRWETFFDRTTERLMAPGKNAAPGPAHARLLQMLVSQRIWSDATYGTLSSDGRFLYAIEESEIAATLHQRKLPEQESNTLVAYYIAGDRRIGQRAWTLGGAAGGDVPDNPLTGTFFLGSPLPLGGQLYCLAEMNGEVRLLVIDPARPGELVWSQPLAGAGLPIHQDLPRRQSGATVAYANGIMVCPTDAGYVIAVDLTQRSLLWGHQYQAGNNVPGQPFPLPRPPRPNTQSGWLDAAATIVDSKVLLTPRSGTDVVCLSLLDGTEVWKKTKQDGLFLAGVVDGKVLLVGTKTVDALSLKDGSDAWKDEAALATPSGRGFIRGGQLYVPLSSAQIAVVAVATGTVVATTKTPDDIVPGNIISVGDAIISQGVDRVDVFPLPNGEKKVASNHN